MSKETSRKGCIAESRIIADMLLRGYSVLKPIDGEARYDLVAERNGKFERIQCKYHTCNKKVITVRCRSGNAGGMKPYSPDEIDWIAVYVDTTDKCYYVPSSMLRRTIFTLRLTPTKNGQAKGIYWADDFLEF